MLISIKMVEGRNCKDCISVGEKKTIDGAEWLRCSSAQTPCDYVMGNGESAEYCIDYKTEGAQNE